MNTLRPLIVAFTTVALAAAPAGCGGSDDAESTSADGAGSRTSSGASGGDPAGFPAGGTAGRGKGNAEEPGSGEAGEGPPLAEGRPPGKPDPQGIPGDAPEYVGSFATKVDGAGASRIGGRLGTPGTWTLILGEKSSTLSSPGQGFSMSLRVSRSRMTFGPAVKADAPPTRGRRREPVAKDPCGGTSGVYRWSLDDEVLTFKRLRDTCAARQVPLSKSWEQNQ